MDNYTTSKDYALLRRLIDRGERVIIILFTESENPECAIAQLDCGIYKLGEKRQYVHMTSDQQFNNWMKYLDVSFIVPSTVETGPSLIAAERQRQIDVEGYQPEADAAWTDGQLAAAAVCYASTAKMREKGQINVYECWPRGWDPNMFKPSPDNRLRDLVKAGALIAAEIDRIIANKKS